MAVLLWWGKSVKFDRAFCAKKIIIAPGYYSRKYGTLFSVASDLIIVSGTFVELNLDSTHGLNQVSSQCCSKVKLIQLGSTYQKYRVSTRPCNAYPGIRGPSLFHDKIEGPWERSVANRLVKQSHSCTEVKSCKQSITSLNGYPKCCNFVVALRRWLFHELWTTGTLFLEKALTHLLIQKSLLSYF